MKTFDQLTPEQQTVAVAKATDGLLTGILEGAIRFNDTLNHDTLQARIDSACEKADRMLTPWFAGEYIMESCREDLEGMARCNAEDALYSEPHEYIVPGVVAS